MMHRRTKIIALLIVFISLIIVTAGATLTITQFTRDTGVFFAPQYASSGTGTENDPYINCLYNSYNLMSSSFKGEIYFPKGYYIENYPIIVDYSVSKPRHFSIIGPGFWDSIIKCSPSMNAPLLTVINHASVYISGIEIDGNKQMQIRCPLIYLKSSYDAVLRDTFLENGKGDGIQVGAVDGSSSAWSTDIINCPIEYFDGNGINITGSSNLVMDSLTLTQNKGYEINAVGVGSSYPDFTVTRSRISSVYKDSIHIGRYCSCIISENVFTDTGGFNSVRFDCSSNGLRQIIISDNIMAGSYGLYFVKASNDRKVTVTGNDFTSCTYPCNYPVLIQRGIVVNNNGLNPFGKWTNPFYHYGDGEYLINLCNGASVPVKNVLYVMQIASARIMSSGGSNVNISIYDGRGNLMKNYGMSCDIVLGVGQGINFGNYNIAPTVSVYFE